MMIINLANLDGGGGGSAAIAMIGDLNNLETTTKTNVVSAINEIVTDVGSANQVLGDLLTNGVNT